MKANQKGLSIVGILIIVAVVGLVGGAGWFAWQSRNNTNKSQEAVSSTSSSTAQANNSKPTQQKQNQDQADFGTITGNASYPSSRLPSDEKVCAEDVANSTKLYCDNIGVRQPANNCKAQNCTPPSSELEYSVKVPAGEYYVYATAEKELPNYKAYYNEYSKCGNSVNCPDAGHKKYIKVTVAANATVENVDPGDWYAN